MQNAFDNQLSEANESVPLFAFDDVGHALLAARKEKNITVEQCAARLCLFARHIHAMESADSSPFPSVSIFVVCIRRYAQLLGVDLTEFEKPDLSESDQKNNGVGVPELAPEKLPFSLPRLDESKKVIATIVIVISVVVFGISELYSPSANSVSLQKDDQPDSAITTALPSAGKENAARVQTASVLVFEVADSTISSDHIFVNSRKAVTIKKRNINEEEGFTKLIFPDGVSQRITILENEIVLIEGDERTEVFFQKRKLSADAIASKQWIQFKKK